MGRKKLAKLSYSRMKRKKQNEKLETELENTANAVPVMHPASQHRMVMPRVPDGGEGSEETQMSAGQSATLDFEDFDTDNIQTCIYTPCQPTIYPPPGFINDNTNILLFVQQNINDRATKSIVWSRLTILHTDWQTHITDMNYIARCLSDVEKAYGEFVKFQTITFNMPERFNIRTLYNLMSEQRRLQANIDCIRDYLLSTDHKFLIRQEETNKLIKIYELYRLDAEMKRLAVVTLFKQLHELDISGYLLHILMSKNFNLQDYIAFNPMYDERVVEFYKRQKPTFIAHQIAHIYLTELRDILLPIKYIINNVALNLEIARVKLVSFKSKCYRLKSSRMEFLKRQGLRHYDRDVLIIFGKLLNNSKEYVNILSLEDFIKSIQDKSAYIQKLNLTKPIKVPVQTKDAITSTTCMNTENTIPPAIIYASPIDVDDADFPDFTISVDRCITPPYIIEYEMITDSSKNLLVSHRGTDPLIGTNKISDVFILLDPADSNEKQDYGSELDKYLLAPEGDESPIDGQSTPIVIQCSDDDDDKDTVILSILYSSQETLVADFPSIDERLADFDGILSPSTNPMIDSTNSVECTISEQIFNATKSETGSVLKSKIKRRKSGKKKLYSPPPPMPERIQYYASEVKSGHSSPRKSRKHKQKKSNKNKHINPTKCDNKIKDQNAQGIDLSQATTSDNKSFNKDIASEGKSNERIPIQTESSHISIDEEIAYGIALTIPESEILDSKYLDTVQIESLEQYAQMQTCSGYTTNANVDDTNTLYIEEQLPEPIQEQSTDDELIVQFTPEYLKTHEIEDIPKEKAKRTHGLKIKSSLHKKQTEALVQEQDNDVQVDHKEQADESINTDQYCEPKVDDQEQLDLNTKSNLKETDDGRNRLTETLSLLMTTDFNLEELIESHFISDEKLNKFLDRKEPISAHEVAITFMRCFHETISQHKQPTQRKMENLVEEQQVDIKENDIDNTTNTIDETILQENNDEAISQPTQREIENLVDVKVEEMQSEQKEKEVDTFKNTNETIIQDQNVTHIDTNKVMSDKQPYKNAMSKIKVLKYEKEPEKVLPPQTEEKLQVIVQTAEDTRIEIIKQLVIRKKKASEQSQINQNTGIEKEKLNVNGQTIEQMNAAPCIQSNIKETDPETTIKKKNVQRFRELKIELDKYQSHKAELEEIQVKQLADTVYGPSEKHSNRHLKLIRLYLAESKEQILEEVTGNLQPESIIVDTARETRHRKRKYQRKPNPESVERWPELDQRAALVRKIKHKSSNVHRNIRTVEVLATTSVSGSTADEVKTKEKKYRKKKIILDDSSVPVPELKPDQPILDDPKDQEDHNTKLEPPQAELQAPIQPAHATEIKSKKRNDADLDPPAFKVKVKRRPVLKPETARVILGAQEEETPKAEEAADAEPAPEIKKHKRVGKFSSPILSTRSVRILDQRKSHAKEQPTAEDIEMAGKQKKDGKKVDIHNKKSKGYKYMKITKPKSNA